MFPSVKKEKLLSSVNKYGHVVIVSMQLFVYYGESANLGKMPANTIGPPQTKQTLFGLSVLNLNGPFLI